LEDGTKLGELMHDGQGILLDFNMNGSLKALAGEYGDAIRYVSGQAKEQAGVSAVLVRPDGIVAWAADNNPDCSEVKRIAGQWFCCD
jgi:hypothetical protein